MRPCPHLTGKSGIYIIFNSKNNKIYVGKTKCFYKRCHQYVYDFKERKIWHINDYLFNAISNIGIEHFDFIPSEFCALSELTEREDFWITELNTLDRNYGYNLRRDDERGLVVSEETSSKMSANLKNQWSSGVRSQHSDKLKKNWEDNPHRREAQSAMFTKYKTKYEYKVHLPDGHIVVLYKELVELGLGNIISTLHRTKSNEGVCKGIKVERIPLGESNEIG